MIVIGDGKARGHRMMIDKIIELDQLLISSIHMTKKEAGRFMKNTKVNNECKQWTWSFILWLFLDFVFVLVEFQFGFSLLFEAGL